MRGPEFGMNMAKMQEQHRASDAFKAAKQAEQEAAEPKEQLRKFGETIDLEASAESIDTVKPEEMGTKKEGVYQEQHAGHTREIELDEGDPNETLKLVGEKEDDVIELTDADLVEEPPKKSYKN